MKESRIQVEQFRKLVRSDADIDEVLNEAYDKTNNIDFDSVVTAYWDGVATTIYWLVDNMADWPEYNE